MSSRGTARLSPDVLDHGLPQVPGGATIGVPSCVRSPLRQPIRWPPEAQRRRSIAAETMMYT